MRAGLGVPAIRWYGRPWTASCKLCSVPGRSRRGVEWDLGPFGGVIRV